MSSYKVIQTIITAFKNSLFYIGMAIPRFWATGKNSAFIKDTFYMNSLIIEKLF